MQVEYESYNNNNNSEHRHRRAVRISALYGINTISVDKAYLLDVVVCYVYSVVYIDSEQIIITETGFFVAIPKRIREWRPIKCREANQSKFQTRIVLIET